MSRGKVEFDWVAVRNGTHYAVTRTNKKVNGLTLRYSDNDIYVLHGTISGNIKPSSWTIDGKYNHLKYTTSDLFMRKVIGLL